MSAPFLSFKEGRSGPASSGEPPRAGLATKERSWAVLGGKWSCRPPARSGKPRHRSYDHNSRSPMMADSRPMTPDAHIQERRGYTQCNMPSDGASAPSFEEHGVGEASLCAASPLPAALCAGAPAAVAVSAARLGLWAVDANSGEGMRPINRRKTRRLAAERRFEEKVT